MKIIRNILLILLASFFFIVLAGIILARIFEDEVTSFAISEINKDLDSDISVGEVKLSLIRKFPDASIVFNDVLIRPVVPDWEQPYADTLISAEHILLSFNILDIINKKYLLKNIDINHGSINLLISEDGTEHFRFWKKKKDNQNQSFEVDLQQVRFTDIDFSFRNRITNQKLNLHTRKADLVGHVSEDQLNLHINLSGIINQYFRDDIGYINKKEIRLNLALNRLKDRFIIEEGDLILDDIHLSSHGEMLTEPVNEIDIELRGQDIRFKSIIKYLPFLRDKIPIGLTYQGQFDLILQIAGPVEKTLIPHINATYQIKNARIASNRMEHSFEKISLIGFYNNGPNNKGATSVIQLGEFSVSYGNSRIRGSMRIDNFISPRLTCLINSQTDLADLNELTLFDSINLSGELNTSATIKGSLEKMMQISQKDLKRFTYQGSMNFRNLSISLIDQAPFLQNISTDLSFDKYLLIKRLNGIIYNTELSLSGRIDNFREYFIDKSGNLWADLDIYAEELALDSLLQAVKSQTVKKREEKDGIFPDKINIKLRFWFDHFSKGNFASHDVRGDLVYHPGILTVNQFEGSAMEGGFKSSGDLEQKADNHYVLRSQSLINHLNISEMFSSFNNFGQDFIQDKHLRGYLSGSIDFFSDFDEDFSIDMNSIKTIGDISIKNGELIEFEPMEKLSGFLGLEEVRHIRFSELNNEIFISNSEIIIPKMEINSSAINLTGSGNHDFNNYYNYKIKLSLSELLSKKMRQKKRSESEFGLIEEAEQGKTNIFLSITGTPEDIKINYDRKAALNGLKVKLQEEKSVLKGIISEEFGILETDTSEQPGIEVKDKKQFLIRFDEEMNDSGIRKGEGKSQQHEKFILEWEEDTIKTPIDKY